MTAQPYPHTGLVCEARTLETMVRAGQVLPHHMLRAMGARGPIYTVTHGGRFSAHHAYAPPPLHYTRALPASEVAVLALARRISCHLRRGRNAIGCDHRVHSLGFGAIALGRLHVLTER